MTNLQTRNTFKIQSVIRNITWKEEIHLGDSASEIATLLPLMTVLEMEMNNVMNNLVVKHLDELEDFFRRDMKFRHARMKHVTRHEREDLLKAIQINFEKIRLISKFEEEVRNQYIDFLDNLHKTLIELIDEGEFFTKEEIAKGKFLTNYEENAKEIVDKFINLFGEYTFGERALTIFASEFADSILYPSIKAGIADDYDEFELRDEIVKEFTERGYLYEA